ncbi:ABC transporter ATP-binding protein [Actinoplanes sp. NPDC051346]|uniref:ABC transporter ATP-binding protein n=1 Tax=Actinoplanes sp. NPDC051346 TaxID=3155048 RepID=UPI0034352E32
MTTSPRQQRPETDDFVLPELRPTWWETGVRARAETGILGVFAEIPGLAAKAVSMAWRTDRLRTATVAAVTIAAGVMATFGLLATQRVLIELFAGGPTPDRVRAALPALVLLGAATAIRGAMGIATGYALNGLTPRVNQEVERQLFEHTTAVRLEAFDDDAFSEGMERATRGSEAAIDLVENTINLFAGVVSLLAVTVAVVVIHPLLLLALLVATVPTAYAALRAGHEQFKSYLAGSTRRRRMWVLQQLMAERVSAPELRSYGLRNFLLNQHDRVMGAQTAVDLALARRVTTTTAIGSATGGLALTGVYILLGVLLIDGQIPLAAAATCVVAVQAAQRALTQTTFQIDRMFTDGQFFNEYVGFLERAATYLPTSANEGSAPEELREIAVRGVSLTYPDRDKPAVDELSVTIRAGETIALVGENGSGKSSLAAMIAGLREPTTGVVNWNGRPLPEWDTDALRARIGVVLQEHHKWPFSAATNIAMGDLTITADRDRIERAASLAAAHQMILDLPHGYDTLLDRTFADGQDLSGGQWQRITAARGFMRDGDLLIMDEPSSALDPRAEDQLFQAIRSRKGSKTTILITHRLANVTHADRILVMHNGAVTEVGTHDELMRANGRYTELFTLQSKGYQSGAQRGLR